eukprot:5947470-Pyramimonas_sp.AAC.1
MQASATLSAERPHASAKRPQMWNKHANADEERATPDAVRILHRRGICHFQMPTRTDVPSQDQEGAPAG